MVKITIAILGGTGKEGPGLALRWANAGYKVIIGSRQAGKAQRIAAELNAQLGSVHGAKRAPVAVPSTRLRTGPGDASEQSRAGDGAQSSFAPVNIVEGMHNADAALHAAVCVLTVVQSAHRSAVESLKNELRGKILVDATARVDFRDPRPPAPPAAAHIAQDILGPDVRVVAAFQTIPAYALRHNLAEPLDSDVLVCADDVEAAGEVIRLARDGGMRAYYAGGLDNAIVVEGLTAVLIAMNKHYKSKTGAIRISGLPDPCLLNLPSPLFLASRSSSPATTW